MQTRPSFSQLVQRIETVLGMVTGYVQLTEAPLQQLSASDDKNDKNEDREMADSDIKSVQVSIPPLQQLRASEDSNGSGGEESSSGHENVEIYESTV